MEIFEVFKHIFSIPFSQQSDTLEPEFDRQSVTLEPYVNIIPLSPAFPPYMYREPIGFLGAFPNMIKDRADKTTGKDAITINWTAAPRLLHLLRDRRIYLQMSR
jgi:hypothetical protein